MSSTFTSRFGKILENINRTSYATNSMIKNIIEASRGDEEFMPIHSFMEGLRLNEKTTGSEIVDLLIGENPEGGLANKIARGTLGFGIDVFADPLTYIGIGGLTKIGKTAKKLTGIKKVMEGSRLATEADKLSPAQRMLGKTLEEQAELGQRSLLTFGDVGILPKAINKAAFGFVAHTANYIKNLPIINDIWKGARNIFDAKTGHKEFDDMVSKIYGEKSIMIEKHMTQLKDIDKALKGVKKEEWPLLQEYIMGKASNVGEHIKKPADMMKNLFRDLAQQEADAGILKTQIDSYLPGVVKADAFDFIRQVGKNMGGDINEINKKLEYANQKILTRDATPSQINAILQAVVGGEPGKIKLDKVHQEIYDRLSDEAKASLGGIQEAGWQLGKKKIGQTGELFETDPLIIATKRAMSSVEALSARDMLNKAKKFGLAKGEWEKLAKTGNTQAIGMRQVKGVDELKGLMFPERIAEALERVHKPLFNINELNNLASRYKGLISFWKRMTLTIFPEYHTRNIIGNFWNNYVVAGLSDPKYYIRAGFLQKMFDKNPLQAEKFWMITEAGEKVNGKQLMDEMREHGLLKTGAVSKETNEALADQVRGANINPLSSRFAPIRAGKKIGETIEDNGKIAHYLFMRQKGYSPMDSVLSAKAALFDYGQLTEFEKNVLRNVFPFYSWSKNNIPLQLKGILTQPGKYSKIAKGKEEFEEQAGTRKTSVKWMPEWMQDSLPVIIARMPEKEQYKVFLLMNWLPAGDLNKILSQDELFKFIGSSLEPFSKETIQQIMGKDIYLEKDIENYPGEMTSYLGIPMSAKMRHRLRMWRILNTLDQINPGSLFGIEGKQKSFLGAERDIMDLSAGEKSAKFLGGIRLYPYDVEKGRRLEKSKLAGLIKKMEYQRNTAQKKGNISKVQELTKKIEELKIKKEEK